jgi:hypothetical protein
MVNSCRAGESALAFLYIGTSDSEPSALLTTVQFVCRQKLRDDACDCSFRLEPETPLYVA